jgi:hypothetical protein
MCAFLVWGLGEHGKPYIGKYTVLRKILFHGRTTNVLVSTTPAPFEPWDSLPLSPTDWIEM